VARIGGTRGVRRRWGTAALVVVIIGLALAGVPAPGLAADEPTATTEPPTIPTTLAPTAEPAVPAIPDNGHGELSALSPAQTLSAEAEYAGLTDAQRALLRQLQAAKETLAVRRFALVALARDVTLARAQLDTARTAERQARARVEETAAQLARVKDEIVALAAAAYRDQTDTWVLGALGSIDTANASTLARAQAYVRSDGSFLGARVDVLADLARRLESERRSAEAARVAAETSAAELDARLEAQTRAFDDAAVATVKAQAAAVRGLGADVGLVAQILNPGSGGDDISAVLAFVQAGQGDPPTLDGILALPIPGAPLSSSFGVRIDPIGGSVGFHAGLDFAADTRTPIRAAAAGTVVVAGDCGDYGTCVVIDHGSQLATLYGHQSQVQVRVGDVVQAGQVLGLVGSTGKSTGPHLHFEVRLRGAPIDPVTTLTA